MKDYKLEEKEINGKLCYFASFTDGANRENTTEIDKAVFDIIKDSQKEMSSQARQDRRYGLCSFDESIGDYDIIDDAEQTGELLKKVWMYIDELTEVQQRRIRFYYIEKKTLAEIGKLECVAPKNILKSINSALDYLRSKKYF